MAKSKVFRTLLVAMVNAIKEFLAFATDNGESQVGDSIKLNDGMATSNYDWSAYPSDTTTIGTYTQTGTVEQIKEIGIDTVYVTQEPQQDNKEVSIKASEVYYAYTNENDSDDNLYTADNVVSSSSVLYENTGTTEFTPEVIEPQPTFTVQSEGLINCTNDNCTISSDGWATGGSNKKLVSTFIPNLSTASNWEFQCTFEYNGGGSSSYGQSILGLATGGGAQIPSLCAFSNGFRMCLSSNGSNWNICDVSKKEYTLTTGQIYNIKFGFTGTEYYLDVKRDEETDFPAQHYWSLSSTTKVYNNTTVYMELMNYAGLESSMYFNGPIDLSKTCIIADGVRANFYNTKSGIIIGNDLYERDIDKDDVKDIIVNIETVDNTTINTVTVSTPSIGYKDKYYYAYTNDNTDTIYTTNNPLDNGTFILQNANIVGTLTENKGVYSGFSPNNYAVYNNIPSNVNSFEIKTKFTIGALPDASTYKSIIAQLNSNMSTPQINVNNGKLFYSHPLGSSWGNPISYSINANSTYWVIVKWKPGTNNTIMLVSTDGKNYTTVGTATNDTIVWTGTISLGVDWSTSTQQIASPFDDGSIDFNETYIKVNNETTPLGSIVLCDDSLQVINPQPDFSVQEIGLNGLIVNRSLLNNNGVYSNFSTSNFLSASDFVPTTTTNWEFLIKFKLPDQVYTGGQCIVAIGNAASGNEEKYNIFIAINNASTNYYIKVSDASYNIIVNPEDAGIGFIPFVANQDVIVRIVGTANSVSVYYSHDNGNNWTTYAEVSNSCALYSSAPCRFGYESISPKGYFRGSINLAESYLSVNGVRKNLYNLQQCILAYNSTYIRNTTSDEIVRQNIPAVIETSANVTSSNNDVVLTEGNYKLFNLTISTGMTAIIESSGINYQVSEMPLLLKKNSGVGLLLKDGNNSYYHNSFVLTRDYDLHYQQINFSYPSGATVSCKVNNVAQSNLTPYVYAGDTVTWTCDNAGTVTTGSYTVTYSSKDGNIQTITIS